MITLPSTFVLGVAALATAAGLTGQPATVVAVRAYVSPLPASSVCHATDTGTGHGAADPSVAVAPTASASTVVSMTVLPRQTC